MLSGDSGERRSGGGRGGPPGERGDREGGYRRRFGEGKEGGGGAPGEFQPQLYVPPITPSSSAVLGWRIGSESPADRLLRYIAVAGSVVDVALLLLRLKCWFAPQKNHLPYAVYLPVLFFSSLLGRIFFFMIKDVAISFGWAGSGKVNSATKMKNKIQKQFPTIRVAYSVQRESSFVPISIFQSLPLGSAVWKMASLPWRTP